MSRQKNLALLYPEAFKEYYGTVQEVIHKPLPFRCTCGETTYQEFDDKLEIMVDKPVMSIDDCWKHIRKTHRERIVSKHRKPKEKN